MIDPRAQAPAPPIPALALQADLVAALRGGAPGEGARPDDLDRAFRRYECGGWLHSAWRTSPPAGLPEIWKTAAAAAHRRTLVDSLAALGGLREVAPLIASVGSPFMLIKGAAYLADLYPDPGARALTDVDLVVPPAFARAVGRRLAEAGFEGAAEPDFAEYGRFEMFRPGPAPCHFEIHWRVGYGGRMRFDQQTLWKRAREVTIEGVGCRVPAPEQALLFHVGHAADHYFGPTLKWALDLVAMLRTWRPDAAALAAGAREAGVTTALHLALEQVETLFPGTAPGALLASTRIGALRRAALRRARATGAAEFFRLGPDDRPRRAVRPYLFDTVGDAAAVIATVLLRPAARLRRRAAGRAALPWEPGPVLN